MRVGGRCCIVPCASPSCVPRSYVPRRQRWVSRRARAVPAHAAAGEVDVVTTVQQSLPQLAYTLRGIYATELTARPVQTAAWTACVLYGISDAFAQSMDTFLSRRAWTNTLPLPRADDSPAADPQQVEELAEELATQDDVVLSDLKVARVLESVDEGLTAALSVGAVDTLAVAYDGPRTWRYMAFGALDGTCSHYWFEALDGFLDRSFPGATGLQQTALSIGFDSVVFAPLWTAAFLSFMSLTSGVGVRGTLMGLRDNWLRLYTGNVAAWAPLNAIIYGLVPLESRVLAFASFTLAYTVVLSVWLEDVGRGETLSE